MQFEQSQQAADGHVVLTRIAERIGAAAGYFQTHDTKAIIADAERLMVRSPERSMATAAAFGLWLGTVLRNRR